MVTWILLGYAIGSVPFAYLLARRVGVDVRVTGSGNVGAANVLRTSGVAPGLIVLALDISKGAMAVLVAQAGTATMDAAAAAGGAAIIGHVYPVWLRFRGGKGVAVATGVFSVLAPFATLVAACVFGAVAATTRIVSLASIAATLTLPSIAWLCGSPPPVFGAAAGVGALILFRHRSNVRRMFARREYRLGERVR